MDCLHACEVLSAAHDGEPVDAALLAEARAHADACAECRRFVRLLGRLGETPTPRASAELIARLREHTTPVAAELRETIASSESAHDSLELVSHPRRRSWVPRFTAFATAAAVVVLALTAGTIALLGGARQAGDETASTETFRTTETPLAAEQSEDTAADTAAAAAAVAEATPAPGYVTFGEEVWQLVGAATQVPSTLTTVGAVTSTLDDGGTGDRPVFFAGTNQTTLYARTTDGRSLAFERVIRTRGRSEYVLVSDAPITAFGMWPALPERFEVPTQPDGSPTFRYFGRDDAQLAVYLPAGGRIEDGFALAPDTPADDPAAGNPNWTWWQRLE